MWAYTATSGGDSASKHIFTLPRRKLSLSPAGTVLVEAGDDVNFAVSAQGAPLVGFTWSSNDASAPNAARVGLPGASLSRMTAVTGVISSSCTGQVPECTDEVGGSYTRTVTATVDDSLQTVSVAVIVGDITAFEPDSTCYELGGSCWNGEPADTLESSQYVAPEVVVRGTFVLDFTDQFGNLHIFTLHNARFIRKKIVKTTTKYVEAIYAVDISSIADQTPSVANETLIWANVIPVKSTLIETSPGSYSGGFVQWGKVTGAFWKPIAP